LLKKQNESQRYAKWQKREYTLYLANFRQRIALDVSTPLYIRFFHGTNTWDAAHIMGTTAKSGAGKHLQLDKNEKEMLDFVLSRYYDLDSDLPRQTSDEPQVRAFYVGKNTVKKFPKRYQFPFPRRAAGALLLLQESFVNRTKSVFSRRSKEPRSAAKNLEAPLNPYCLSSANQSKNKQPGRES
jgi:hypothetical protein